MASKAPSMLYVTAESLAEGAAAHVHVNEIIGGLTRRGWRTSLIEPGYDKTGSAPGVSQRVRAIGRVNARAVRLLDEVDAVYCRAHPLLMPLAWQARRRGVPLVQECNGLYADIAIAYPWTRPILGSLSAMQRWQYRHADGVVTISDELGAWLARERGRDDIKVIPNGANVEMFAAGIAARRPVDKPYVVFFGALAAWQGIATLLAAVRHPDWPREVELVIIGDGSERARVEAAVADGQPVTYLGRQPYQRMPELIVGALAGIVPIEEIEGRPQVNSALKLYETLAAGLPAIVTDYRAQAALITDYDCGIVIPPRAPAALAGAVARLWRDPDVARAMGSRGRAAVVREHSWDQRAGEVERLLDTVVRSQRGAEP